MAIDVNKRSSSDYPTKLTTPIPSPSHRDYQRNKNQTIPTTTTNYQDFDVPPDTPRLRPGRCSFAIAPLSLTMRIPPTCHKVPVKSILKTSTAHPSPYVDHQHHFSQQNPRSIAKENGEKSALVRLLEEQAREFEEARTLQLQKDEEDHTRQLEEHA